MPADSPAITSDLRHLRRLAAALPEAQASRDRPCLLLHGTALDSARLTYGQLMPRLGQTFRVFALDWPGYGQSDKPETEYTMAFYAGVLERFVSHLKR